LSLSLPRRNRVELELVEISSKKPTPRRWTRMQHSYDVAQARRREKQIKAQAFIITRKNATKIAGPGE
jgi:hypothetical protein